MDNNNSHSSEPDKGKKDSTTKKRKRTGRMKDVMKVLRAESHELGPDCACKKLRCFEAVPEEERRRIIREFNALGDNDKQNSYLGGLITVSPVKRRGWKVEQSRFNAASFTYRVLVRRDGAARDVRVCLKAFMSLHGISEDKVRYIRTALVATGESPTDMRGRHSNRPHKLSEETLSKMDNFLESVLGRKSNHLPVDARRTCLPEGLSIAKLHARYLTRNPDNVISYETFREYFERKFDVSVGSFGKDRSTARDSLESESTLVDYQDSDPRTSEKTVHDLQSKGRV